MNKCAYIMDMPENCSECDFACDLYPQRIKLCQLTQVEIWKQDENQILDCCPLIPKPERMLVWSDKDGEYEYERGYNQCIDDIFGKEGEEE